MGRIVASDYSIDKLVSSGYTFPYLTEGPFGREAVSQRFAGLRRFSRPRPANLPIAEAGFSFDLMK